MAEVTICSDFGAQNNKVLTLFQWKQWKQCQTLLFGAPKSLQMVAAAMTLKDAYSLEEKL